MPAPDVLIVGGGAIGLSCGVELARRNHVGNGPPGRVMVLERDEVGARTGAASWAGAGMLPPASLEAAATPHDRLRAFAHARWDDWAARLREDTGVEIGYERRGSLLVTHPDYGGGGAAEGHRQAWATVRELPPGGGRVKCPGLSRDVTDAAFLPDAGQVRNPRLLRALRSAGYGGMTVREGVPVRSVRTAGRRAVGVTTDAGDRLDAGAVLICGGAWAGGLLADVGFAAPVRPVRGQMALLRCDRRPFGPTVECGGRYLVPRADGRVIVGATQEEAGFHAATTAAGVGDLLDFARTLFPPLAGAAVETTWAGLRPGTPDGAPLLGRVPHPEGGAFENLFVAAGHFRDGLQQSPATAAILADLIEGKASAVLLDGLEPGRFLSRGDG